MLDDERAEWLERALCAEVGPDLFFVERGESVRPAKQVCMACPVRRECLRAALEQGEEHGIWGGLTPAERRREAREQVA